MAAAVVFMISAITFRNFCIYYLRTVSAGAH